MQMYFLSNKHKNKIIRTLISGNVADVIQSYMMHFIIIKLRLVNLKKKP